MPPQIAPKFALGLSVGSGSEAIPGSGDELGNPQDFNDLLFGDAGDDFMFGGGGRDELFGGGGSDYLDGGVERDEVFGEGGDDVVRGGANDDVVHGDYKYENGSTDRDIGGVIVAGLVGDEGIDQVYGDGGTRLPVRRRRPLQRRHGRCGSSAASACGAATASTSSTPSPTSASPTTRPTIAAEVALWGDELHGGAGRDWLYGNLRRDVIFGDSGNDSSPATASRGRRSRSTPSRRPSAAPT